MVCVDLSRIVRALENEKITVRSWRGGFEEKYEKKKKKNMTK